MPTELNMSNQNFQANYITELAKNRLPVSIYLCSGLHLKGYLSACDDIAVELEHNGSRQLVYKHAIATICLRSDKEA